MANATLTSEETEGKERNVWGGGESPMKVSYGKLMMWFFLLSDALTFSAFLIAYGVSRYTHNSLSFFKESKDFTDALPEFSEQVAVYGEEGIKSAIGVAQRWPVPEEVFNALPFLHGFDAPLVFVGIMTFILILSSVTMVLAVEAGERKDQKDVEKWMLWTIIGGIAFLGCQAWEWSHFIHGTDNGAFASLMPSDGKVFGANLITNEYGPALFGDLFFFITGFHGFHVFTGIILNILIFYNTVMGVYAKRGHYEMVEKVGLYWHFVDLVWVFVFTLFYLI
ncbi:MAG: cytochrome c oxidase subunit 3 [Flammeovirgaceae bacterium]|jgi:cytochrome c oxidase subunit 3